MDRASELDGNRVGGNKKGCLERDAWKGIYRKSNAEIERLENAETGGKI
jgi:hypothetical protein